MYLNIILILFLIICLLNITDSKIITGGNNSNKELNLHKNIQVNINNLKNKLNEIDSEIEINKKTLEKYKNNMFTSTTRIQMFETQIIIKNLISEKEKTINLLEKTLKKYEKMLTGGKKKDPLDIIEKEHKEKLKELENESVMENSLLEKSQEITKKIGVIMGESMPTVKPKKPIKIEHISESIRNNNDDNNDDNNNDNDNNDNYNDDNDDEIGEVNLDSSENNYIELISDEDDLENEEANNIAQDIEREEFNNNMRSYIEANSNNVDT